MCMEMQTTNHMATFKILKHVARKYVRQSVASEWSIWSWDKLAAWCLLWQEFF